MKAVAWEAGLVSLTGITLLAIFGIAGRVPNSYDVMEISQADEAKLRAYRDPVMAVAKLGAAPSDEAVASAVEVWIKAYEADQLHSVAPSHLDDIGDKGVRGEILRSRRNLSTKLQLIASRVVKVDPVAASGHYLNLVTLNEIHKFSNPDTMTDSTYFQYVGLKGLERVAPKLSPSQRTEVSKKIASMERPGEPLGPFTSRINNAYRRSEVRSVEEGVRISTALRNLSTTPEVAEAKSNTDIAIADSQEMLKIISTTMYMALRSEQRIREEADQLIVDLRNP